MTRLHKWIQIIQSKKGRSFGVAFVLLIVAALGMRPSSACLKTESTPLAIVDLELAFDQMHAEAIKESWANHHCNGGLSISSTAAEAAMVNIILDFAFIPAYSWFLIVLFALTATSANPFGKSTQIGCYLAIIAGSLDVIENLFMILFLFGGKINSMFFAVPASMKFALIVALIFWILIRWMARLVLKSS